MAEEHASPSPVTPPVSAPPPPAADDLRGGAVPNISDRVEIWWPDDGAYYSGRVTRFSESDGFFFIEYDDGETEYLDMKTERWRKIRASAPATDTSALDPPRRRRHTAPSAPAPAATPASAAPSKPAVSNTPAVPSAPSPPAVPRFTASPGSTSPLNAASQQPAPRSPRKSEPLVATTDDTNPTLDAAQPPSKKLEPWKRGAAAVAPPTSSKRTNSSGPSTPTSSTKLPRYMLQPRLSNGKFGALPANMRTTTARSKNSEVVLEMGIGKSSGKFGALAANMRTSTTRSKNSEVVLESGSGNDVVAKPKQRGTASAKLGISKSASTSHIGSTTPAQAVVVHSAGASKRPAQGPLQKAGSGVRASGSSSPMAVTGSAGVKRQLGAMHAGKTGTAAPPHSDKARKAGGTAMHASNSIAAAASTGLSHGEMPKKKIRMMSGAGTQQPAQAAPSPIAGVTPTVPTSHASRPAGAPRKTAGAPRTSGSSHTGTAGRTGAGGTPRVHPPGSRGAEQSVVARNFAALKEGVGDTKLEIGKLLRSVTHLHSMHNDLTKQMRIDDQESTRRYAMLNNEVERVQHELRSLSNGQKDILSQLAAIMDRLDGVPYHNYAPRARTPHRAGFGQQVQHPAYAPMDYERVPPPPAATAALQRRHSYTRNPRRAHTEYEWAAPMAAPPGAQRVVTTPRDVFRPTVPARPTAPARRVSADRVPAPGGGATHSRAGDSFIMSAKSDILLLVARQATIWLLETDHECRDNDQSAWARQEATKCMERVAYLLNKFSDYSYAMRTLADSLGTDAGQLQWFTEAATSESLGLARQNYDVWDPPPTDAEWVHEEKLLIEISERFHHALNNYELSIVESSLTTCVNIASLAAGAQPPAPRLANGVARRPDAANGDQGRERQHAEQPQIAEAAGRRASGHEPPYVGNRSGAM